MVAQAGPSGAAGTSDKEFDVVVWGATGEVFHKRIVIVC